MKDRVLIRIWLSEEESDALDCLAERELRPATMQIKAILREALRREGLLKSDKSHGEEVRNDQGRN